MKKIIYTRRDGGLSIVSPIEGARLAYAITLPDGRKLENLRCVVPAKLVKESVTKIVKGATFVKPAVWSDPVVERVPGAVDGFLRMWPVPGATADWAETEDEFVARIAKKDIPVTLTNPPSGVPAMLNRLDAERLQLAYTETAFHIVDESAIPADRTFRDALTADGPTLRHDMSKCREIHKNTLRALRAPKLAALDIEFMHAVETGDTAKQNQIAAQKQALRDVTADPRFKAASTPEELKLVIPDALLQSLAPQAVDRG